MQIPGRFFRIAVWVENGSLRSLAMIVDQSRVIDVWPEALFATGGEALPAAEAFMDGDELDKVEDFLSTIAAVEVATDLDFGELVRGADVRAGEKDVRIDKPSDIVLKAPSSRAPKTPRTPRKGR